jgi:hypothetical protein
VDNRSLTLADALAALSNGIGAEDALIAGRMTWYVTSQAFLLTAYATSWNANFVWPQFFHEFLPIAAVVLSAVILASSYAATWAQETYLRTQADLVAKIRAEVLLSPSEILALAAYEQTMIPNRKSRHGRVMGTPVHWLVRVTPLVLPVGFTLLWIYAYLRAPA